MNKNQPDRSFSLSRLMSRVKGVVAAPDIRLPLFVLICLLVAIAVGGYFLFQTQSRIETERIQQNLAAVAELKSDQINQWIERSKSNSLITSRASPVADRTLVWLSKGMKSGEDFEWLSSRLGALRHIYSSSEMVITDASGKALISTEPQLPNLTNLELLMRRAIKEGRPVVGDFRWSRLERGNPYISVPVAAPLIPTGEGSKTIGVLLIMADAHQFLYPLIQKWPTPSETAETLLLMRAGNDVVYLNELRHQKGVALQLRFPVDEPNRIVSKAGRGEIGFVNGLDYRKEPVIGYALRIPDTNWLMIAKIDEQEAYAPLRQMAFTRIVFVLILLTVSSVSLFFWWQTRKAEWKRQTAESQARELQAELRQQFLSRQYESLSKYANDIILLSDRNNKIMEVNDRAETAYGLPRSELIGKSLFDLLASDSRVSYEDRYRQIIEKGGAIFESVHRRSDGTEFPVESSARLIERGSDLFVQYIVRDITERRKAEAELQRSEAYFRALNTAISDAGYYMSADWSEMRQLHGGDFIPDTRSPKGNWEWLYSYIPSEEQPRVLAAIHEAIRSKSKFELEHQVIRTDGSTGWTLSRAVPVLDDRGGIVEWIGVANDISERKQAEEARARTLGQYRAVVENITDGVLIFDRHGNRLSMNKMALEILGYEKEEDVPATEALFQEVFDLYDMRWHKLTLNEWPVTRVLMGEKVPEQEYYFVDRSTGNTKILEFGAVPIGNETNQIDLCVITGRDVTERKSAEESMKLAAAVYKESSEAMMILDEHRHIIMVNQAFADMTGYEFDDVLGQHPRLLRTGHPGDDYYNKDDAFYQEMWQQADKTGRFRGEIWHKKKDGQSIAVRLTVNVVSGESSLPHRYVVLLSDITEKKRSDELIWSQANFDTLTGLPNRRFFRERLEQEVRNARRSKLPLALLFIDLDGFKDVNDTLGHDMGDLLLKEAAERLHHCVRESDTVARLGGDEFTVILTELHDYRDVDRVARHILQSLSEHITLGEELAYVSASVGITLFPNDADQVEDLIKNADQAMYAAKESGKNQYHYFTQAMQDAVVARMRLINDLRGAMEGNQFEIVYQPIVEMATGKIHKAEALIRWQHPEKGIINPIDFISAAEDTGMITSFGNWIFHEAARQVAEWRERCHSEFQISVNISPVQFKKEGIDPTIWFEHLRSLDLPGQGIVVEITEGLLLVENPKVTDQLLMLRDAGIEVALDDFGTGYSSLAYLQKFDIDYVKIDQAFVRNLAADSNELALCEAMIVMAHKLNIRVIAEGVETDRQNELLANSGCDFAQGYYFSRPVPAEEFERLLEVDPFSFQESLNI